MVALLALAFGAVATGEDGRDRDGGFWALVVLSCTYVGVLVSRLVSGRAWGAALVARHAVAGVGVGLVLAVGLTIWSRDADWLGLWLLICLPAGALVGAVTAGSALAVPQGVAPGLALVGVLATAALLWLTLRPQPPYDLVAVDSTEQVAAAGGAVGVAQRVAAAVERTGGTGDLRTAPWWEAVADEVSGRFIDSRPALSFTGVQDLPASAATGERVRLMTVRVRGAESACVVVEAGAARVVPGGSCEDLDVTR